MTTQRFEFVSNGNRLSGFVDVPAGGAARAMIVIILGYGKTDGAGRTSYYDLPSRFPQLGISTHLPKEELPSALSSLRLRLAQNGALLVVITRKNLMTKFLIEWWWQARSYSRRDLQEAFAAAGFGTVGFRRFPYVIFG